MPGFQAPQNMPHLLNMNEDRLLNECLIYCLQPGRTVVGAQPSTEVRRAGGRYGPGRPRRLITLSWAPIPLCAALQAQHEIVLTGEGVQDPHCYFDWNDNVVTVTPVENAYARRSPFLAHSPRGLSGRPPPRAVPRAR